MKKELNLDDRNECHLNPKTKNNPLSFNKLKTIFNKTKKSSIPNKHDPSYSNNFIQLCIHKISYPKTHSIKLKKFIKIFLFLGKRMCWRPIKIIITFPLSISTSSTYDREYVCAHIWILCGDPRDRIENKKKYNFNNFVCDDVMRLKTIYANIFYLN